ncbi:ArnT family glycosyltransferase [Planctomicrobium piriforme]|uniref:4-amino-4-deoxy-L-arabinose transferase n=1 Tax=Planctomicrobium piriforme TaxID=1576369 RepID=A0A1I3MQR0_9PLAN|nr:glycosyltransferase family 39 protein [Planctomicrobium piriforme]SFI99140.1 4-amino-4-deoxy-L-arabinose transferase [Planctomicrobium piriforme]
MTALTSIPAGVNWRPWIWVAGICVLFLIARLPVILHEAGSMDEDWFAIPGWTVSQEGIPRVPYAPERNRQSFFWKADVVSLALPPALHYFQAPFFWLFPAGYPTARLPSLLAGMASIVLVYRIGRRMLSDERSAVLAAALYSLSRLCYFPAIVARPDMLCGMFGLAALLLVLKWQAENRWRWLIAAGVCLGVGGLTHPAAIVYAVQLGIWVCLSGSFRQRFLAISTLVGVSMAMLLLWLPLMLTYREIFRVQFFGNVLSRTAPSGDLLTTAWQVFNYQGALAHEHFGAIWLSLLLCGLIWTGWQGIAARDSRSRTLCGLTCLAVGLLIAFEGRHPTKGYWCYPGALLCLCFSQLVGDIANRFGVRSRWAFIALSLLSVASLLPGSGLRATAVYLRHWSDPAYHARTFIREVLKKLPQDGVFAVDPAYVFDVEMSGRETLLGVNVPIYFQVSAFPCDYLIASRYSLKNELPRQLNAVPVASYGDPDNPFTCYVEIFQVTKPAPHVE